MLDVEEYVKHIAASFAFFFGFGLIGNVVSLPLLHTVFAPQPRGWPALLTMALGLTIPETSLLRAEEVIE